VEWFSPEHLRQLFSTYGYWSVAGIVALESMGLPVPGETVLVLAALFAARHHEMSLAGVMAAATVGAILGDNIGYWVGREFGYRLLLRYGAYVGLSDARIKLGQYLFLRHGRKVVFFGRFIPVLRILAGLLAGTNRMPWRQFLIANAAGAVLWVGVIGTSAYAFGRALLRVTGPAAVCLFIVGAGLLIAAGQFIRRHEGELEAEAERALPGPLRRRRPSRSKGAGKRGAGKPAPPGTTA
jgi:membrane protein DedA with SNARE-associated domain